MYYDNYSIEIENLSKTYMVYSRPIDRLIQSFNNKKKRYTEFQALKPFSMKIKPGTTVGIVGRNGSGKSTLLQMIAGTLTPTEGTIKVNGRVSALLELGAGFNLEYTGRDNVFLNASILGIPNHIVEERFDELLAFSEIGEFIDRPVKTYSSGMFVRLAFSVITITNPEIIIIDEALSVGDEKFQRKCYNYLETLKEKGCTILFVSHSMKTVEQLCDYAYLLDRGELIGEGEPKKIIDQYHLLLYSQENEHLKYINSSSKNEEIAQSISVEQDDSPDINDNQSKEGSVKIDTVKLFNQNGEESYVFKPDDDLTISLLLSSSVEDEEVAIGLRIKTTQGIEVYGTSTMYHDLVISLQKSKKYRVDFKQKINLVDGTYHISVAIAKKIGSSDMIYYDKLSDFILFKVEEIPLKGTGIANLNSEITIMEV